MSKRGLESITDVPINVEGDKNSTDSAMLESSASFSFSKLKGFKIGQINIASLVKHHHELLVYMQSKSLDVFTVNETRLDISVLDCEVEIPGYDIVRLDRNRNGGWVAIFIRGNTVGVKSMSPVDIKLLFVMPISA